MAKPVRATLALAPGGSFICPYTRAAFEPGIGLPVALSTYMMMMISMIMMRMILIDIAKQN